MRYPRPRVASHHDVAVRQFTRGFGGMMALEVVGGVSGGQRFCDALELVWVATSLGGTHPGRTRGLDHAPADGSRRATAAGIADGLVRVSVGIEDDEDILDDLERALETV